MTETQTNPRRRMWQAWKHTEKARDFAVEMRAAAHKDERLDLEQFYTEFIFHNSKERAFLRKICRGAFSCDPDELESYK